ncbi:MAG: DUF4011 domain-containing protein [Bacilli bacterium]|nr:DUF4011 domain-containing protein [Bacilli bacterium]
MEKDLVILTTDLADSINYVNYQAEVLLKKRKGTNKQNFYSFLRKVSIKNDSLVDIEHATLSISSDSPFIVIEDTILTDIQRNKITEVDAFSCTVNAMELYKLNAPMVTTLTLRLCDQDGEVITHKTEVLKILPIEEAASDIIGDKIDILSSFVTPEDDEVKKVARDASNILMNTYGRSDFAGYQYHDPNKVKEEAHAVYLALQSLNIRYSEPPASFEKTFQKVRLPYQVIKEKVGTCLDISLLYCSVLESIGLNPLLNIVKGHAFAGVMLDDEHLPHNVEDNLTLLSNAISDGINEILVINPTDVTVASFPVPFENSIINGKDYLINHPGLLAIDIVSSHRGETLPIPTPHGLSDGTYSIDTSILEKDYNDTIEKIDLEHRGVIMNKEDYRPKDKFEYWEEKLLDLNLKNKLINLNFPKNGVEFIVPDSIKFIEFLSKNEKVSIDCSINCTSSKENKGPYMFSRIEYGDLADAAYRRGAILGCSELNRGDDYLKSLSRKATTALEESGCNPLFLTLGIIRWFDNEKAAKNNSGSMFAPLFLLPIRMPKRKSGLYYSFEYSIEDLQLNTTLFQYFQHNCGLDITDISTENLPKDSNGIVDVRKIFNTIKKRIEAKDNWTLIEDVSTISIFSFAHFTMWTDLKTRREELLKNPVVRSLYEGVKSWDDRDDLVSYEDMDNKLDPSSLAIPLPADSSQIKAISDSLQGESFVLDGPPGTGKSQTIANMIINYMNHGKSVLFVAEKEVALNVVKKRLDDLGLGDFTLELSSANASKSQVLARLGAMLDYGSTKSPEDYSKIANDLSIKREALNSVLDKIHKENGFFLSCYDAIVGYLSLAKYKGKLTIDEQYAASLTKESYEIAIDELSNLENKISINGEYSSNALLGFTSRVYSLSNRDKALEDIANYSSVLRKHQLDLYNAFLKLKDVTPTTRNNAEALCAMVTALREEGGVHEKVLGYETFREKYELIRDLIVHVRDKFALEEDLLSRWEESVFSMNAKQAKKDYEAAMQLGFFKRIGAKNAVESPWKKHAKDKKVFKAFERELDELISRELLVEAISLSGPYEKKVLAELNITNKAGAENALSIIDKTKNISDCLSSMTTFREEDKDKLVEYAKFLINSEEVWENRNFDLLISDLKILHETETNLKSKYEFVISKYGDFDNYFDRLSSKLNEGVNNGGRVGEWTSLLVELDMARNYVPDSLIDAYEEGKLKGVEIIPSFKNAVFYRILSCVLDKDNLGALSSREIDNTIEKYGSLIDEFSSLVIKETAAKVTANYPMANYNYAGSTAIAALKKLAKNGGRNTTLRQIFNDDEFSSLIKKVCPCMLMSPLAVAQYLEPGKYHFDAVIFDEASQIPTSEAIGAIGRGKCCIIAGDEQQMPPTNFFSSNITLDGATDDLFSSTGEDLESLLDDVIVLGIPRRRLTCHYRSKHESLIAFSNKKFYKNGLLTFPSAQEEKECVSYRFVGGFYEQGRGRNVQEAEAIVKEVVTRLKDEELSKHSIGIVTFNEAQQNLIDDLLDKEFAKHPEYPTTPGGEEIFVKNLENVQGDERDVILFSITYGHDKKTGNFGLNFGPLSRERGERRLNVAVSRAREKMIVFASIDPEEIRSERTKNDGARYLKEFLLFAKYGVDAITNSYENASMHDEMSIADFLAEDLRKKGFKVDINVGASTFKVDLAIYNPVNPEEYVLGVLLDGRSYECSATCRDRNIVQPSMLRRLKWNLIRVWSVEYFDHKAEVISRIINAVNDAKNGGGSSGNESRPCTEDIVFEKEEKQTGKNAIGYRAYMPNPVELEDPKAFEAVELIAPQLREAIETEYPVSEKRLESIFKGVIGTTRLGDATKNLFFKCLRYIEMPHEICSGNKFYWPNSEQMAQYQFYRPLTEEVDRKITDYSFIELGNLYNDILLIQGKISLEDLEKIALSVLGFKVLNSTVERYLTSALKSNIRWRHNIDMDKDGFVFLF